MVRATATSITAAAVAIAEGHAAIAGIISSLPQHLVVAQLIGSIFILEAESAVPADLSAFEAQPDSVLTITALAQVAQPLQQLIVVSTPGMVVKRCSTHNSFYSRRCFIAGINADDLI